MTLAINPTVTTYASRTPYLTAAEYTNAPTSVDIDDLVDGGTDDQNAAELLNVIARASSWMDSYCRQVLAATLDIDPVRRYRVNRDGVMIVPLRRKPILEIDAISYGPSTSQMSAMTTTMAADLVIGASTIEIPVTGLANATNTIAPANEFPSFRAGSRLLVQVAYVNGYPNTLLATVANEGDSSITVGAAVGVYPGSTLTVYDDAQEGEQIQVATSYIVGSTTLPLVAPLESGHAAGVSVSALPPVVKEAAIAVVNSRLKSRGADTIQMAITTTPGSATPSDPGGPDLAAAKDMLTDFRRVR